MVEPIRTKLPNYLEEALEFAKTFEELKSWLDEWVKKAYITKGQAADAYDKHRLRIDPYTFLDVPEEIKEYLNAFTSERDLADRLQRLGIEESMANQLYQGILSGETPSGLAMRQAKGRALTEAEKAQVAREDRSRDLMQAWNQTFNNPLVTQQDLARSREALNRSSEAFLAGEDATIFTELSAINQRAEQRAVGEGQTAEALLAGLRREGVREPAERKPIPGELGVARSFLEETGLGAGTRLRSFIAGQIPGIAEGTRGARERWWRGVQEPQPPTFEEEQSRAQAEMGRWGRMALTAPSSEIAGGVYYGPGGLRAIAQRAYQRSQEVVSGLRPEDFPEAEPTTTPEDPFLTELKRRRYRAEYFRQPGTGLARRLTPAARF